ncbi:MAG: class I SAM-dependent methyltransferase [Verrucomicrobia bacterium]|nr:class I SAM-dependent methyltransferase [Verrucomicrobiota bacterium]
MHSNSEQKLNRICPVCLETRKEEVLAKQELLLVRCQSCEMVFADQVPAQYADAFYNEVADSLYLSEEKLQSDYATVRFEREIKLLRHHLSSGRILDVGCSTGAFLYQVKKRWPKSYDILGTDICQPALAYAKRQQVSVVEESFLKCDFGESHFDAITFWAVLEHLLDPRLFLAKAASLLKPGGFCFILVPNFRSLATRLLGAKYRYIFPQHVNYFTSATLRKLVGTESNWKIVEEGSCHFNPMVIWQDRKNKGAAFVSDQERVKLLKATTSYKQNPLLAPIKWAYNFSEKCLGATNLADNIYIVLQKQNQ